MVEVLIETMTKGMTIGADKGHDRQPFVKDIFGWMNAIALLRKTRHRVEDRVGRMFTFTTAVHNVGQIRNLDATVW
jgi:hypothetical protein